MSRTISRLAASAALLAAALAAPAAAGVHFTAVEKFTDEDGSVITFTAEGWTSPGGARIELHNPTLPNASHSGVVLVRDDGKSVYYVDPGKKTYWRMDQVANLRAIGASLQVADPKLEKLLDEDGGVILGQKAHHARYRISYRTSVEDPSMSLQAVIEKEVWSAPQIPEEGVAAWLLSGLLPSGDAAFEKLLVQMKETMKGLPLKLAITSSTTITYNGKSDMPHGRRLEAEIKSLETTKDDETRLAFPAGYTEMQLPGGAGATPHD